VGDYRIFYTFAPGWVRMLSVRKRDERTYGDSMPAFADPTTLPPASTTLEPQASTQQPAQGSSHTLVPAQPAPPPPDKTPLPYALSAELLQQWHIPADYHEALLAVPDMKTLIDLGDIPYART
jgi:hypothetical protein